jgi:nucleotide-binding universal stress UspA family protein
MKKILIAVDGSESSFKAVAYASVQFAGISDLHITLFHVLQGLPPEFWDAGHIFSDAENVAKKKLVDKWLANQKQQFEPDMQKAREMLTRQGIKPEQIDITYVCEPIAMVPECILAEAQKGSYQTLVIGRCGKHHVKHLLLGDTASNVVNYGTGLAICVVG